MSAIFKPTKKGIDGKKRTPVNTRQKSSKKSPPVVAPSNGQPDQNDFLFLGDSSEKKEEKWLNQIRELFERKKLVPEADKFTPYLEQLYNALHKELCKKCGTKFEPIFEDQQMVTLDSQDTVKSDRGHQVTPDKTEVEELRNKIKCIEIDLDKTKDEKSKLQQEKENLKSKIQSLEENVQKLNNDLRENNEKMKNVQQNNLTVKDDTLLTSRIDEQNRRIEQLQNEKSVMEDSTKLLMAEKAKDEEELKEKTKALEKETSTRNQLAKENSDLQDKIKKLLSEVSSLQLSNSNQEKNIETRGKQQIDKLTSENERLTSQERKFEQLFESKDKEITKLNDTIKGLKEERDTLNSLVDKIKSQQEKDGNELKKLKKEAAKDPDKRIKDLQEESNVLRDRLSQIAGSKMTDGNPAIADLGDPNRPTQLGEKFSELYDNEWTDAMEELEKAGDEKANVNTLRTIVERAYEFGKTRSGAFMKEVEKSLLSLSNSIQITPAISKLIKELRKNIASLVTEAIYQAFLGSHTEFKVGGENVKTFIRKTVGLCWFMAIQDPPLVLTTKVSGKLDTDRFRHYTKSGTTIDYVVWPVVFLHEGGPIICKGVAQGK